MPVGLLGRKVGMTQVYNDVGKIVPVTVIELGPCTVLQMRTVDRDGYEAVQIGFADKPRRLASRSERGHVAPLASKRQKSLSAAGVAVLEKAGCEPKKFVREFRTDGEQVDLQVGQELKVDRFAEIKFVDVIGTTKGRGFAGVMKRHNFSGQPAAHGAKKVHRQLGSTGQNTYPGKVMRGKKMPGHYGHSRVTVRHLKVARVDLENNLLLIQGAAPGPTGGYLVVRPSNKYK
ncbi:MAG: 50S ribosomal protein L3 [Planctomycetota bacterium]|nr:50S ribosomal protein L3 [Planctomycetota bacterium]MDA1214849.1 50S ribosomal protein L3 [Planctomycetota bacterium]